MGISVRCFFIRFPEQRNECIWFPKLLQTSISEGIGFQPESETKGFVSVPWFIFCSNIRMLTPNGFNPFSLRHMARRSSISCCCQSIRMNCPLQLTLEVASNLLLSNITPFPQKLTLVPGYICLNQLHFSYDNKQRCTIVRTVNILCGFMSLRIPQLPDLENCGTLSLPSSSASGRSWKVQWFVIALE